MKQPARTHRPTSPKAGETAPRNRKITAVIAAGGTGIRIGAPVPKQFLELSGKPILLRTVESVVALEDVAEVVIALPEAHIPAAEAILRRRTWSVPVKCVPGGATRQESVHRGVRSASEDAGLFLVHDAVRPFCDRETMERVVDAAWRKGGAVPTVAVTDTIQRVSRRGVILKTAPREQLHAIQTPQCFRAEILRFALERASAAGFTGTDESSVVRWAGYQVSAVAGCHANIKITHAGDLATAERYLQEQGGGGTQPETERSRMTRIGQGIDYHRLVEGRKLILGGVVIPFERGLAGHSDADVLCHAVCDALLGAAGLGDIGMHFPDTDPEHLDRSSLDFLRETGKKIGAAGWRIRNVDATVLAERPKIASFIEEMKTRVALSLGLEPAEVSIKATTTEGLNAEGRGEGISAQAVALLERL